MADELNKDIEELESLLAKAERAHVRSMLQGHLDDLRRQLQMMRQAEVAQPTNPVLLSVNPMSEAPTRIYETFPSFAWEDAGENVKIYLSLDNVGTVPSENISVRFNQRECELKIHDLNGRSYSFLRSNLNDDIKPDQSRYIKKANRLILVLKKQVGNRTWYDLTEKKKPQSSSKKDGKDGDIMSMLKDIYDQGDDTTKRTLAQAWTESQKKRAGM
eukprot:TRINITY_DN11926_c0_g1::TRINITY_DN11926_c0_g1_i1::g.17033::m.17033 TRINITY_DN11926_c0_g1::TRINITY_DN11926_c0_g1_i1::g.17033  ORF type:complete len:246 (-),score=39.10,sp/Q4R4P3/CYBP_MACFA/33.04/2e-29,SGS/PF05002.10/7.7e-10,Siah-Interact_N/PF09032.6/9.9e-10,Siah-Interact_N/PF09032.6/6e+03,CS/PF04969.11/2.4e-09,Flg_hook/PF02120.11/0.032,Flg_hook/PF02120.11/3e+03,Apolipoprotein/PF01442.13/0.017,DUF947/PF06102.7/1.3,DUF947/PF06102.7/72 TRINITY_DN11926_c0_g1_i1:561-1208(-)